MDDEFKWSKIDWSDGNMENINKFHINQKVFRREYFGEFPVPTFLDWVEDFVNQLENVKEPEQHKGNDFEYLKRLVLMRLKN